MSEQIELKFHIDAFTPATIPMKVLIEYLGDLSIILGEVHSVHFNRLEGGSTTPVVRVDQEALQSVMKRAHAVRMNEGPLEAQKAKRRMEQRLAEHHATGADLIDFRSGDRILHFKGRGEPHEVYGPVKQAAEITGAVVAIGGRNDPAYVHLEDGDRQYTCEARIEVAKRLRPCLFESTVRASGQGTYFRNDQGEWEMQRFRITDFEVLDHPDFGSLLERLRNVKSDWLEGENPLAAFRKDD
jgi:hypothetical protein